MASATPCGRTFWGGNLGARKCSVSMGRSSCPRRRYTWTTSRRARWAVVTKRRRAVASATRCGRTFWGGKLGRKKVLGMSGSKFLATKKTEVIKLSAKVREKVAHLLFVRTHTHTALFGDKRNTTRRRVNPHDCHTNAHTQQKDGGHAGIVTAPRLVDANRAVCTVYDNFLRLLDGQVHTLFPATNVAKVTKSHVTDTLKHSSKGTVWPL